MKLHLLFALALLAAPAQAAITAVSLVPVAVADQDQAKTYYVETLGMTVRTDVPMASGERWLTVGVPGQALELTLVPRSNPHAPAVQHLVLASDDIDGDFTRLQARGVRFTTPVTDDEWGRFAVFADPFGNQMILTQAFGQHERR